MRRAAASSLVPVAVLVAGCGGSPRGGDVGDRRRRARRSDGAADVARPLRRSAGSRPSPRARSTSAVQDAAAAPFGGGAVLLGGLTAADTSTRRRSSPSTRAGSRRVGQLPRRVHDAAAVTLGTLSISSAAARRRAARHDRDASTRAPARREAVGHLPAPSSDQAAAAIGGTAYIVGGYTGTRWLDTIVAWRPGAARARRRAPAAAVRYAAVTAVGGRLVIAGGSLRAGTASDAVLRVHARDRPRAPHRAAARRRRRTPPRRRSADRVRDRRPRRVVGTPTDRIVARRPRDADGRRRGLAAAAAVGPDGGRHAAAGSSSRAASRRRHGRARSSSCAARCRAHDGRGAAERAAARRREQRLRGRPRGQAQPGRAQRASRSSTCRTATATPST